MAGKRAAQGKDSPISEGSLLNFRMPPEQAEALKLDLVREHLSRQLLAYTLVRAWLESLNPENQGTEYETGWITTEQVRALAARLAQLDAARAAATD